MKSNPNKTVGPLTRCVQKAFQPSVLAQAQAITVGKNNDDRIRFGVVDHPWTVEDVLSVALRNGLDEMERRYCKKED